MKSSVRLRSSPPPRLFFVLSFWNKRKILLGKEINKKEWTRVIILHLFFCSQGHWCLKPSAPASYLFQRIMPLAQQEISIPCLLKSLYTFLKAKQSFLWIPKNNRLAYKRKENNYRSLYPSTSKGQGKRRQVSLGWNKKDLYPFYGKQRRRDNSFAYKRKKLFCLRKDNACIPLPARDNG